MENEERLQKYSFYIVKQGTEGFNIIKKYIDVDRDIAKLESKLGIVTRCMDMSLYENGDYYVALTLREGSDEEKMNTDLEEISPNKFFNDVNIGQYINHGSVGTDYFNRNILLTIENQRTNSLIAKLNSDDNIEYVKGCREGIERYTENKVKELKANNKEYANTDDDTVKKLLLSEVGKQADDGSKLYNGLKVMRDNGQSGLIEDSQGSILRLIDSGKYTPLQIAEVMGTSVYIIEFLMSRAELLTDMWYFTVFMQDLDKAYESLL